MKGSRSRKEINRLACRHPKALPPKYLSHNLVFITRRHADARVLHRVIQHRYRLVSHQKRVLSESDTPHATAFSKGDTEVRSEVSHLEHAAASAVVICARGSSGWANTSHRLKAVAQLEGRLARVTAVLQLEGHDHSRRGWGVLFKLTHSGL
jgi:hypothetical protein